MTRIDIKAILRDPHKRRELMVETIIATQAREGIETTREQAEVAYDAVQAELHPDLKQLVRNYFAAKAAFERTSGGRWLNLKGAARTNVRERDRKLFSAADDALRAAVGVDGYGKVKEGA